VATVYQVDVRVGLLDEFSTPMQRLSGSMDGARRSGRDLETQLNRAGESANRMGQYFQFFMAQRAVHMLVDVTRTAVKDAADLETAWTNAANALNLTNKELQNLQKTSLDVIPHHLIQAQEYAQIFQTVASGRGKEAAMGLMSDQSGFLKFVDQMIASKTEDSKEAALHASQFLLHTSGTNPDDAMDIFFKGVRADPQHSPAGLLQTFMRLSPLATVASTGLTEQVQMAAFLNQMSEGTRGGTGMSNIIMRTMEGAGGGKVNKAEERGLKALGLYGPDGFVGKEGGAQGLAKIMETLRAKATEAEAGGPEGISKFVTEAREAFQMRGGREAIIASFKQGTELFDQLKQTWDKQRSLADANAASLKTFNAQLTITSTNLFQTLATFGTILNTKIIPPLEKLGDVLGAIPKIATQTETGKVGAENVAYGGATFGAGAALGVLGLGVGLLVPGVGWVADAAALTAAFGGATMAASTLPIGVGIYQLHKGGEALSVQEDAEAELKAGKGPKMSAPHIIINGPVNVNANNAHEFHKSIVREMVRNPSSGATVGTGPTLNHRTK
jgi:hypothetical protein